MVAEKNMELIRITTGFKSTISHLLNRATTLGPAALNTNFCYLSSILIQILSAPAEIWQQYSMRDLQVKEPAWSKQNLTFLQRFSHRVDVRTRFVYSKQVEIEIPKTPTYIHSVSVVRLKFRNQLKLSREHYHQLRQQCY